MLHLYQQKATRTIKNKCSIWKLNAWGLSSLWQDLLCGVTSIKGSKCYPQPPLLPPISPISTHICHQNCTHNVCLSWSSPLSRKLSMNTPAVPTHTCSLGPEHHCIPGRSACCPPPLSAFWRPACTPMIFLGCISPLSLVYLMGYTSSYISSVEGFSSQLDSPFDSVLQTSVKHLLPANHIIKSQQGKTR